MNTDFKEIEKKALRLDRQSKVRLVEILLESMKAGIDPDIEQAWIEEVGRRKKSLSTGNATLHDSDEVLYDARKRLRK